MRAFLALAVAAFLSACATTPSKPQVTLHMAAFEAGPGLVEMVEPGSGRKVFVAPEPVVAADDVVSVKEMFSPNGQSGVMMKLSDAGAQRLGQATADHIGAPMAVLVNGKLTSAPVVRSKIVSTELMLGGTYTMQEIHRLLHPPAGE